MKRVIIIGASSGIGRELAIHYINAGYIVGIAARRENLLEELKAINPSNVFYKKMDTSKPSAKEELLELIEMCGGMDRFIYCSGVGYINKEIDIEQEIQTVEVNVYGFTHLIDVAYHYFRERGNGHIVGISSVAGVRTISISPSYSASKKYNNMYLKAISQLAKQNKLNIKTTTILPGFIKTDLIKNRNYPLTTSIEKGGKMIFDAIQKEKKVAFCPSYWGFISGLMLLIPSCLWSKIIK
ncbi:MAG: SDR family NAD(P)-dependent oxidoreductase [Bacteroidales bacterium]|nr:SDR family NAD(P)-dependent oxidoreductase [Bacteroidales bacterium]